MWKVREPPTKSEAAQVGDWCNSRAQLHTGFLRCKKTYLASVWVRKAALAPLTPDYAQTVNALKDRVAWWEWRNPTARAAQANPAATKQQPRSRSAQWVTELLRHPLRSKAPQNDTAQWVSYRAQCTQVWSSSRHLARLYSVCSERVRLLAVLLLSFTKFLRNVLKKEPQNLKKIFFLDDGNTGTFKVLTVIRNLS